MFRVQRAPHVALGWPQADKLPLGESLACHGPMAVAALIITLFVRAGVCTLCPCSGAHCCAWPLLGHALMGAVLAKRRKVCQCVQVFGVRGGASAATRLFWLRCAAQLPIGGLHPRVSELACEWTLACRALAAACVL